MLRYRLRTLLILLALGPVVLAGIWCAYTTPPLWDGPYFGPPPPALRPGLNVSGLVLAASLPVIVLAARRLIFGRRTDNHPWTSAGSSR
jgi:hypothetical protein